jgi:hypothetical protein
MAAKSSKNNAQNRGMSAPLRLHNGKKVQPVQYDGTSLTRGKRKYIAGRYKDGDGSLILDDFGTPIPYDRFEEDKIQ